MIYFNKYKLVLLTLSLAFTAAMAGNGYQMSKHNIGSGGGISEGGGYKLHGSVAQAVSKISSNNGYSISSGFWQQAIVQPDPIFANSFE